MAPPAPAPAAATGGVWPETPMAVCIWSSATPRVLRMNCRSLAVTLFTTLAKSRMQLMSLVGTAWWGPPSCTPCSSSTQYWLLRTSPSCRLISTRFADSTLSGVMGLAPARSKSVSLQACSARWAFTGLAVTVTRYQLPARFSKAVRWKFASYVSRFCSRTLLNSRRFTTSRSRPRATLAKSGWSQRASASGGGPVARNRSSRCVPSCR
mmetsp:Transcript_22913/g.31741  ORF Transcript_22913/g.31741 Transcript_22913/m.31741 type:complete len:209 (-) Transcript_22913:1737-2363(-)